MRVRGLALLVLPSLMLSAGGHRRGGPVHSAKEAKAIAERDTGGHAVSAHPIHLNGASGGWEVDVHMDHEHQGWRCTIDDDAHQVFSKTRIPNPSSPEKKKHHD